MNFNPLPSLEVLALRRMVNILWNIEDVPTVLDGANDSRPCEDWLNILESKACEKVTQLLCPETLKKEISGLFLKQSVMEIGRWLGEHGFCTKLPKNFCWEPHGIIDRRKTAETLVKDENSSITERYILACINCLEDDIIELWNRMPENHRTEFYRGRTLSEGDEQQELVGLWTEDLKNGIFSTDKTTKCEGCLYQYGPEIAVKTYNVAAVEYFFKKLTPKERKEYLWSCTLIENCYYIPGGDVLLFLLSQMDSEQQIKVLKRRCYKVLRALLVWRWPSLFLESLNRMWDFLDKDDYCELLILIAHFQSIFYNLRFLVRKFWEQSPDPYKRYFIDVCINDGSFRCLEHLFKLKNKDDISSVLNSASHADRKKVIFSSNGAAICKRLIVRDEWDLLIFFIRICIASQETMIKFKEEFKDYLIQPLKREVAENKANWDKFFELLDGCISEYGEKECLEAGYGPDKKV